MDFYALPLRDSAFVQHGWRGLELQRGLGQEVLSHLHVRLRVTAAASIREHFVLVSVSPWDSAAPVYAEEKGDAEKNLEEENANLDAVALHLLVFERQLDSWATVFPPCFRPSMALHSLSPWEGQV
jgi:hypothetical protein